MAVSVIKLAFRRRHLRLFKLTKMKSKTEYCTVLFSIMLHMNSDKHFDWLNNQNNKYVDELVQHPVLKTVSGFEFRIRMVVRVV